MFWDKFFSEFTFIFTLCQGVAKNKSLTI